MYIGNKKINLKNLSKNQRARLREIKRIYEEAPQKTENLVDFLMYDLFDMKLKDLQTLDYNTYTNKISSFIQEQQIDDYIIVRVMDRLQEIEGLNGNSSGVRQVKSRAHYLLDRIVNMVANYGSEAVVQAFNKLPSQIADQLYNPVVVVATSDGLEVIEDALDFVEPLLSGEIIE